MRMKKEKAQVSTKLTTPEMELCIVNPRSGAFPFNRYMVLPRTRWGINGINHECDLIALSKTGTLHEIEIKISKSDLLAEKRKNHNHKSRIIKRFWYAVPEEMKDFALLHIPEKAGLITCDRGCSSVIRRAYAGKSEKPNQEVVEHMYELLQMRYWSEKIREHNRIQKRKK